MSVWFAIPSKRPAADVEPLLALWRSRGYRLAIFRDEGDDAVRSDLAIVGKYEGYAKTVNYLVRNILDSDAQASWIVTGGDDTEPDPLRTAEEIAAECSRHFGVLQAKFRLTESRQVSRDDEPLRVACEGVPYSTFGVMQPTGDRWGAEVGGQGSAYIDRVAGSPWLGRDFCRRMYQGAGPLSPAYFHMCVDDELQAVAIKYVCFWQRRDLVHFHRHWMRDLGSGGLNVGCRAPSHLERANAQMEEARNIFDRRSFEGFKDAAPLDDDHLPEGLVVRS